MNILEMWQKIKNYAEDAVSEWGIIAIVILVGMGSFGLGRLSALEEPPLAVAVHQVAAAGASPEMSPGGQIVASRGGSVYHYPWCAGAQAMSPQNKIWFESEAAAQSAGYRPAKNCKGLGE